MTENLLLTLVLGISVLGVVAAFLLAKWVLSRDTGTAAMRAISDAIREGANAFLKRQYKTIIILALMCAAALFIGYGFIREHRDFDPVGSSMELAFWITLSFVFGAVCSLFAGFIGMWVSIRSNIRSAAGAIKSVNDSLQVALRGGAVSGLMVVSMSLLGVGGLYLLVKVFAGGIDPTKIPFLIVGYGFGASFVALFAQLGGGIYTKAADVGADLVGKVEAGIPEDDPRNPAVIADLVGDNVGDCAGRGADLFESTAAENIGAMILAGVMAKDVPGATPEWIIGVMMFPLFARALGIIASIIGVVSVKVKGDEAPMSALNRGYFITIALAILGLAAASRLLFFHESAPDGWLYLFGAGVVGVLTSVAFIYITEYYTDYTHRPVLSIAEASQTGPATNIIAGMGVGLESTALSALTIAVAIISAYWLGNKSGFPHAGIFGTAVATMGMLGSAAYVLAMDTFGPIADNAGGIIEMSDQPEDVRQRTDKLDAAGNTTKALTKGYAIGSAALAAFLLFSAYLDEVRNYGHDIQSVDLANPYVFVGGLIGAALVFIFSSLAIRAVGKAAYYVIQDVREQFKEKPGILKGTEKPDYGRCVDIVTKGALKQMVLPGLVVVLTPIVAGVIFRAFDIGAEAVASLLMVGTIAGILMAAFLNNGGGAWDNAKKYVELGNYGGKRSETHKAAVVGDTVGDPFKDTAGPSLHVLIKLLSTITLVLAPLFI
ncbi:MAG: sodium-translocating pyrophosphatase [Nitrospirae bacterium]|nr:sodium-translocating pyrophosphatase [Nitrospirota bacterium]